jgi:hypothetical protein
MIIYTILDSEAYINLLDQRHLAWKKAITFFTV